MLADPGQRPAANLLDDLLDRADRDSLPPVTWQIGTGATLQLTISGSGMTAGQVRAAFDTWVAVVDAVVWDTTGPHVLHAANDRGRVHVAVHAVLPAWPPPLLPPGGTP